GCGAGIIGAVDDHRLRERRRGQLTRVCGLPPLLDERRRAGDMRTGMGRTRGVAMTRVDVPPEIIPTGARGDNPGPRRHDVRTKTPVSRRTAAREAGDLVDVVSVDGAA